MHTHRVVFKGPTPLCSAGNPEVQRVVPPGPSGATVNWGAICFLVISFLFIHPFSLFPLFSAPSSSPSYVFDSTFCFWEGFLPQPSPLHARPLKRRRQTESSGLRVRIAPGYKHWAECCEFRGAEMWWNITAWTLNPDQLSMAVDIK